MKTFKQYITEDKKDIVNQLQGKTFKIPIKTFHDIQGDCTLNNDEYWVKLKPSIQFYLIVKVSDASSLIGLWDSKELLNIKNKNDKLEEFVDLIDIQVDEKTIGTDSINKNNNYPNVYNDLSREKRSYIISHVLLNKLEKFIEVYKYVQKTGEWIPNVFEHISDRQIFREIFGSINVFITTEIKKLFKQQ